MTEMNQDNPGAARQSVATVFLTFLGLGFTSFGGPVAHLGVNAAVVGLLLAALYSPVWTSGILSAADFALGMAAFTLLVFWKLPPWLVVLLSAAGGWALHAL